MKHRKKPRRQRDEQIFTNRAERGKRCQDAVVTYKGFSPDVFWPIEGVPLASLSAGDFFYQFVKWRMPVVLTDSLSGEFKGLQRWTNSYLRQRAGDSFVDVEHRRNDFDQFGEGRKVRMAFGAFLDELDKGREDLYLTTQTIDETGTGPVSLTGHPASALLADVPLRPKLFGHLLPYQYNVWMGQSRAGTTSGLHHDFHDNLYVLLRGRKVFRLYSPDKAHQLDTTCNVSVIHPNGLICYQKGIGEDGAPRAAVHQWKLGRVCQRYSDLQRTASQHGCEDSRRDAAIQEADDECATYMTMGGSASRCGPRRTQGTHSLGRHHMVAHECASVAADDDAEDDFDTLTAEEDEPATSTQDKDGSSSRPPQVVPEGEKPPSFCRRNTVDRHLPPAPGLTDNPDPIWQQYHQAIHSEQTSLHCA
ncbi:unnamed protein product [Vitrella brassicaformis CCMP3155]|uniref:Cupin-like domain-containing protein n=1 Tax=Vitrella brassicaformis (strain CCMP3155) TaxID=1169540 RepID=A0A0G4GIH7_VITBC|nr:unnamed protein product [Vitrella brassicaformis CCMP3155]|eukprot:CEM29673.1 unnamed protein product [Vitrella brassicaformis CCMP3155]